MEELASDLSPGLDPLRPVHDRPVAGAAKMGSDLLGPLVRSIHRVRPADRVVVVGFRAAELVETRGKILRRFEVPIAGDRHYLIKGALERAFGRRAIVTDDDVDEGIVQNLEVPQCIDQPPDLVIGVRHESGVDFHLARQHWLHLSGG